MLGVVCSLKELRGEVQKDDATSKKKELDEKGTGSYGYGGKFGVQKDRMDKVALYVFYVCNEYFYATGVKAKV